MRAWREGARAQLEQVRELLNSLEVELKEQGPEYHAAGDMDALRTLEEARAGLETEEAWWESFAPPGERW